ncbi:Por secretion system C-terminal sorting domain-containing protein [Aquimarina amphilecti]|uniref:Por secretion system C-terminal sorting domain-containing protein n=1 Tax=Aquimarina amphilecti TaxID=1038014 RepID=A0A1H7WFV8_AQUAM|nr:T9SS type A sorting domain-containing protein [Aquimarina amphilecti]SEM20360.1 Por secretion system C-terminal sorting domain-containing protein [Aquimarina amphilecti]
MKKSLLLLFLLSIAMSVYAQRPNLSGSSITCAVTQKYTVENVTCFIKIKDVIISGNGFYRPHPFDKYSFYVDWINLTNQDLNSLLTVEYEYYQRNFGSSGGTIQGNPLCSSTKKNNSLVKQIIIKGDPVGIPNPVQNGLSSSFPKKHTFSTSASNASKYIWNIQGGIIIGCNTCSSIQVQANPGVCTITGTVIAENFCGRRSNLVSFNKTITRPSAISNISGPTYVGAYGDFKTYSVSPNANATSYRWYFAQGSQFLGSSKSNIISVFCNTNNTTATTLYVVAQNSCGQSSVKGKAITGGIDPPYKSAVSNQQSGWKNINKVTVVNNQENEIIVLVPDYQNTKNLEIYSLSGKMIKSFTPREIENKIDTSSLTSGIYILIAKTTTQKESIKFHLK